jgi:hypothetical protein
MLYLVAGKALEERHESARFGGSLFIIFIIVFANNWLPIVNISVASSIKLIIILYK